MYMVSRQVLASFRLDNLPGYSVQKQVYYSSSVQTFTMHGFHRMHIRESSKNYYQYVALQAGCNLRPI